MSTAIEFNGISKQYRLGLVSTRTLSHDINRWWTINVRHKEDPYLKVGSVNDRTQAADSEYVWALRNIDFKVECGDVVGIIGKNGAGKSTLLKILSKITGPTTGSIRARGRIGSLLEVGTGFHPEMTGRENIYLNGAILGMTKAEITRKLDEIVAFSGCERYIDTPVKRYSSGMMVRLGFAVAAHLDPEILVVDEVLAVGDYEFQKKAIGKMKDVSQGEGRTVLFVSHNMASIRTLCHTGIVLNNGQLAYSGDVNSAIDFYTGQTGAQSADTVCIVNNSIRITDLVGPVRFVELRHVKNATVYASDEDIPIHITLFSDKDVKDCRINCTVYSAEGIPVGCISSDQHFSIKANETKRVQYTIINPGFVTGSYSISFSVGLGNMMTGETNFDIIKNAITFSIDKPFAKQDTYYVVWHNNLWGNILMKSRLDELM